MVSESRNSVVVSVIIPAWRLVEGLYDCLEALSRQVESPTFEVIVVVNGASPIVLAIANAHPVTSKVIPLAANLGFGLACNVGAESAQGKYLVFLNDDTVVDSRWLNNLVEAAKSHGAAVVGGVQMKDKNIVYEAGSRVLSSLSMMPFAVYEDIDTLVGDPRLEARQVDFVSGAGFLVDAEVFRQMGGFDPIFAPAYYEDVDLQSRIRAAGYQVWFDPSAKMIHSIHGSTRELTLFREFAIDNAREAFTGRWGAHIQNAPLETDSVDVLWPLPDQRISVKGLESALQDESAVNAKALEIQTQYSKWLELRLAQVIEQGEEERREAQVKYDTLHAAAEADSIAFRAAAASELEQVRTAAAVELEQVRADAAGEIARARAAALEALEVSRNEVETSCEERISQLQFTVEKLSVELDEAETQRAQALFELNLANTRAAELTAHSQALEQKLSQIFDSTSWQITAPIRLAGKARLASPSLPSLPSRRRRNYK